MGASATAVWLSWCSLTCHPCRSKTSNGSSPAVASGATPEWYAQGVADSVTVSSSGMCMQAVMAARTNSQRTLHLRFTFCFSLTVLRSSFPGGTASVRGRVGSTPQRVLSSSGGNLLSCVCCSLHAVHVPHAIRHCQLVAPPAWFLHDVASLRHEYVNPDQLLQESSFPGRDHQPQCVALFSFLPQLPRC